MKKTLIAGSLSAVTALLLWPGTASAHHPEITVSSICVDGGSSFVSIHTEAWKTWDDGSMVDDERRVNTNVVVTMAEKNLQDVVITVGKGVYNAANGFQFNLSTVQPTSAGSVVVRVTSVANWGTNGQYEGAGEFREATVDLSDDCRTFTTTTTTPPTITTPSIVPVTTTTSAGGGDSRVVERDFPTAPAIPVVVTPKFAG